MKKIEAIIRPEKIKDVKKKLDEIRYPGITISEVEGHGRQKGISQQWRGQEYKIDLLPKIKVEILAKDDDVDKLVNAIVESAKTGSVGDGKIFVLDVIEVVRIRTGERGETAL